MSLFAAASTFPVTDTKRAQERHEEQGRGVGVPLLMPPHLHFWPVRRPVIDGAGVTFDSFCVAAGVRAGERHHESQIWLKRCRESAESGC